MIKTTVRFRNRAGASVRVVWHEVLDDGGWRWQCVGCPRNSPFLDAERQVKQEARAHAASCQQPAGGGLKPQ